jgi:hypothetical protein
MYNSLFWSISPQDAVTQGGFLVDIVDDDILDGMVTDVLSLYWRRNDGRGSVFYFTCMLCAKMYVHYKKQNDCAQ